MLVTIIIMSSCGLEEPYMWGQLYAQSSIFSAKLTKGIDAAPSSMQV